MNFVRVQEVNEDSMWMVQCRYILESIWGWGGMDVATHLIGQLVLWRCDPECTK